VPLLVVLMTQLERVFRLVAFAIAQQAVAAWYSPWRRAKLTHFGASISGVICGLTLCLFSLPAALIGWGPNLHHLDTW
jgi:hypothetical protein